MSILEKRVQLLTVADFDYLSARILLNSGIPFTGLPKAAEALEKLLKLLLILEAKISRNEELDSKTLKSYGHNLSRLFKAVNDKIPVDFGTEWGDYFEELERSYNRRYPDNWDIEMTFVTDIKKLDEVYSYLRENVILNFPYEEQEKVKKFGVLYIAAYTDEICLSIEENGGSPPLKALKINNGSIDRFDLSNR